MPSLVPRPLLLLVVWGRDRLSRTQTILQARSNRGHAHPRGSDEMSFLQYKGSIEEGDTVIVCRVRCVL